MILVSICCPKMKRKQMKLMVCKIFCLLFVSHTVNSHSPSLCQVHFSKCPSFRDSVVKTYTQNSVVTGQVRCTSQKSVGHIGKIYNFEDVYCTLNINRCIIFISSIPTQRICFKKIKVMSLLITSFIPKITWSFVPFYNASLVSCFFR